MLAKSAGVYRLIKPSLSAQRWKMAYGGVRNISKRLPVHFPKPSCVIPAIGCS